MGEVRRLVYVYALLACWHHPYIESLPTLWYVSSTLILPYAVHFPEVACSSVSNLHFLFLDLASHCLLFQNLLLCFQLTFSLLQFSILLSSRSSQWLISFISTSCCHFDVLPSCFLRAAQLPWCLEKGLCFVSDSLPCKNRTLEVSMSANFELTMHELQVPGSKKEFKWRQSRDCQWKWETRMH